MKKAMKMLWVVVATPLALVAVIWVFLRGCERAIVCDPVPPPNTSPAPNRDGKRPTDPNLAPVICDPVHVPPPSPTPRAGDAP